jgi:hypothetical protein
MPLRLLKVAAVQIVTLFFLGVVAFFAYAVFASNNAKSKAEAVCNSVAIGAGIDVAAKVIEGVEAEARLRSASPEFLSVGFRGAFVERWSCSFKISDGKVAAHEVRLFD